MDSRNEIDLEEAGSDLSLNLSGPPEAVGALSSTLYST